MGPKLSTNKNTKKRRSWRKVLLIAVITIAVLAAASLVGARIWYDRNLRPVSSESLIVRVEIPLDSSLDEIANILHSKSVIRSTLAFKTYVRGREYADLLRAGVYELDSSKSTQDIVEILVVGDEAKELVAFPPGLRLDQIRSRLIDAGFDAAQVDAALDPGQYEGHPALVSKPTGASLEGYLYPDSYQISGGTTAAAIVEQSLDEMAERLTPDRIEDFARQGLTIHEAIILASIIEREVHQTEDRRIVAQIFLKRLREGIPLGADATYVYAAAITGEEAWPGLDNPYNTRMYAGLPPGPISSVGETSLDAVAHPADTDYLFFVSGDDGKNYFAKTQEEHDQNIKNHCQKNCQ